MITDRPMFIRIGYLGTTQDMGPIEEVLQNSMTVISLIGFSKRLVKVVSIRADQEIKYGGLTFLARKSAFETRMML